MWECLQQNFAFVMSRIKYNIEKFHFLLPHTFSPAEGQQQLCKEAYFGSYLKRCLHTDYHLLVVKWSQWFYLYIQPVFFCWEWGLSIRKSRKEKDRTERQIRRKKGKKKRKEKRAEWLKLVILIFISKTQMSVSYAIPKKN